MTASTAAKIRANNEIPPGYGNIAHVKTLLAQWFPGFDLEVIATSGPGVQDEIGQPMPSEDGWLHFNLIVSYGMHNHRTSYLRSISYKNFCEGEVGKCLGHLEVAHEMRVVCKRWIEIARGEIAAYGTAPSLLRANSEARLTTWNQALNAIPMFGWNLTK